MNQRTNYWTDLPTPELHDAFSVVQLSPSTFLSHIVGADYIHIQPNQTSEVHRHNHSETIIYITRGEGRMELDNNILDVHEGMRLYVGQSVFHGFRTDDAPLEFISIQIPPILDHERDHFDKERKPD